MYKHFDGRANLKDVSLFSYRWCRNSDTQTGTDSRAYRTKEENELE